MWRSCPGRLPAPPLSEFAELRVAGDVVELALVVDFDIVDAVLQARRADGVSVHGNATLRVNEVDPLGEVLRLLRAVAVRVRLGGRLLLGARFRGAVDEGSCGIVGDDVIAIEQALATGHLKAGKSEE